MLVRRLQVALDLLLEQVALDLLLEQVLALQMQVV